MLGKSVALLMLGWVLAGCSESHGIRPGDPCIEEHAGGIAEDGCSSCLCAHQRWSCILHDECNCGTDPLNRSSPVLSFASPCSCQLGQLHCAAPAFPRCPSPREDAGCGGDAVWAQDPIDGFCCPYEAACAAPEGWALAPTRDACDPLGCGRREPSAYKLQAPPVACSCLTRECPTLADALAAPCQQGVELLRGCGKVQLRVLALGPSWHLDFDEASGALIGRGEGNDVPSSPFFLWGIEPGAWFGEPFDCPGAPICAACGSGGEWVQFCSQPNP